MSLWLRDIIYMKKCGRVCLPDLINGHLKSFTHTCVIPGSQVIDIYPVFISVITESFEGFGNRPFHSLVFFRNRNTITIIPDKKSNGYLLNRSGIYSLPKMTFTGRSIANGTKTNLIAFVRKCCELMQFLYIPK